MTDMFDIANLITTVGVDAVKIKQEPGLPEKSSNEILTELFSTFDADDTPVDDCVDDDNDDDGGENDIDRAKKKKKKNKKKHKHNKDKKHKKRSRKKSSCSDSDFEVNDSKKKKKHKKKLKRKRNNSNSSNSSDSDEPKVKIKKESEFSVGKSPINNESTTVFDAIHSVLLKKESLCTENEEISNIKREDCRSPKLPPISKKADDELEIPVVPRLLEKVNASVKGKILIKDLKNSSVYNETVRKVETEVKEKAARMEDGELSESDDLDNNRTPTLSPTPPPQDEYDLDKRNEQSDARSSRHIKGDLRLVLKQKEKSKKKDGSRSSHSRNDDETRNKSSKNHHHRESRSKDKRSSSCHSKDRHESTSSSSRNRKRSRSRGRDSRRTRSKERKHRDRSSDRRSGRSKERSSRYNVDHHDNRRSRSEDKHRDRRSRGRSRSTERKERIEIDKKKLLEIARKNAITMIKRGALPLAQQDKAIAAIQAGGKSVDELIDFCKSLSKSEALGELSSVSSDEGGSETEKGFHHPFLLKERPNSIVMNIRDSKQLPTKTFQERTTESSTQLRLQFPVSSGQQHRKTENDWIDVTPPPPAKKLETKKSFVASSTSLQPQAFTIIPPVNAPPVAQTVATVPPAPVVIPQPQIIPVVPPPVVSTPELGPTVFPQPTVDNVDVGTIVSQRLAAMRKLRENPHDVQALSEMYHAQNEMRTWAESKQMPGQFTGSTGAKVLSPAELTSGYQAWARKDQLTSAQPVSGGMGMALLQKMGWRPGEGLGKHKAGTLEPLQLEVKLDKRGLVSDQDIGVKSGKAPGKPVIPTTKTLEGKHPVSLLGEYCSKRKFGAPAYELCFECGPDHKKNFLFKVKVNGIEYKPSVASPNKKQAKAEAAQICLQTLGLLATQ
ncbi:hypothetical protein PV327_002348 [Microctonus hyperodae]|uniref:Protein SON n=1 Tax=Microctonus hyperodae TaxID=165561 RepID=A0AA39FFE0_MICHY|nr:hypothetical protein PV327_002348 [Microctonus hyperodae]